MGGRCREKYCQLSRGGNSLPSVKTVFSIVGGVVLIGGLAYVVKDDLFPSKPKLEVTEQNPGDRQDSLKKAFAEGAEVTGDKKAYFGIAEKHFAKLIHGLENKNGKAIAELFDAEMMTRCIDTRGLYKFSSEQQIRAEGRGLKLSLPGVFLKLANNLNVERGKVVNVDVVNDSQIIVYSRMFCDEEGTSSKYRWWMVKTGEGKWVFYDYEDLDESMRFSTLVGIAVAEAAGGDASKLPWMSDYKLMQQQMMSGDVESLLVSVDKVLKYKIPAVYEANTRMYKAAALGAVERYEDGIKQLDTVATLLPDSVSHLYMKATYLSALDRDDEALKAFDEYVAVLGWDSDVHELVADIYIARGDMEKAEEHWKKGLADNPNAYGCMATAADGLPDERKEELVAYLEAAKYKAKAYENVLAYLFDLENLERAKWLVGVMKTNLKDEKDLIERCEAYLKELEADPAEMEGEEE